MSRPRLLLLVTVLALAVLPIVSLKAATGQWVSEPGVHVRLIAVTDTVGQSNDLRAGVQVSLEYGWDTYWRSPGDAGAAPTVDWSGSTNVASVDWRWPAPRRLTLVGIESFGYLDDVVFPLTVHPIRPGEPVTLRASLDILVCSTLCVPRHLDVSLDLPAGAGAADPQTANLIARYEAQVPNDASRSGLAVEAVGAIQDNPAGLQVRITSQEPLSPQTDVIVESPRWSFGPPALSIAPDGRTAMARLPVTGGPDVIALPGDSVIVTLVDGMRASETAILVGAAAVESMDWLRSLVPFIGVALLGGLVLNLMPCVLPVLGLKLMAVLRHQGAERQRIRLGFLATAAGIIASMLTFAAVLAGLKATGLSVGWGMQFQQPAFLVLTAGALIVFAVNLMGLWEVALPPRLATFFGTAGGKGLGGDFLAGAFTTALATPCSAPFVGTAVAFALARGPAETLAIFAALGVGLAAPHVLVAAFPGLVRLLPRPGRWMNRVRQVLAMALLGTATWLLAVLSAQTSWQAATVVAASLGLLAVTPALRNRLGAPAALALALAALSGAVAAPTMFRRQAATVASSFWEPFDEAAIKRLVAEGKTVFVDVTAEWCANCKVNEALVLDRPETAAALQEPHIVAMRADWTRPDQRISDYLAKNDRFGIPFNAVYGPGAPRGIPLSEVLTREAVLGALQQASTTAPR